MQFEHLPNELFIEITSYLSAIDTVLAFSHLNNRFQCLLLEFCQIFNFQSVSKTTFDFIFRYHDTNRWKSLQLADDENTPGQIQYFLQNYLPTHHFHQLQSLSILNLRSHDNDSFLAQLSSFANLTSLMIGSVCGTNMSQIDLLANLKKLVISSCDETKWMRKFSQMEIIEFTFIHQHFRIANITWPSTLKYLKIIFTYDDELVLLQHSIANLSQLITLQIYQTQRGQLLPNGQIWEHIVRSSLPLLKRFKIFFQFQYSLSTSNSIEQLMATFSSPFYLTEKNWFVRCDDLSHEVGRNIAVLYSLPFAFNRFTIFTNSFHQSMSTGLNDHGKRNIYASVKTLVIKERFFNPCESFHEAKVVNLVINDYFDSIDWIQLLTQLRHLEITSTATISSKHFRLLLNNVPHFYSLTIEKNILRALTENWTNVSICHHLFEKILSLKLDRDAVRSAFMKKSEFQNIMRIFASKCQHLSLYVQSPNHTIGVLLQRMPQLCSLHVCITGRDHPPIDMLWLEQQETKYNSSNCIIVSNSENYYFWL